MKSNSSALYIYLYGSFVRFITIQPSFLVEILVSYNDKLWKKNIFWTMNKLSLSRRVKVNAQCFSTKVLVGSHHCYIQIYEMSTDLESVFAFVKIWTTTVPSCKLCANSGEMISASSRYIWKSSKSYRIDNPVGEYLDWASVFTHTLTLCSNTEPHYLKAECFCCWPLKIVQWKVSPVAEHHNGRPGFTSIPFCRRSQWQAFAKLWHEKAKRDWEGLL